MAATATNRIRCPDCGDWVCMTHGGHIGEFCDCTPCDGCGDLYPPDELNRFSLCSTCDDDEMTLLVGD